MSTNYLIDRFKGISTSRRKALRRTRNKNIAIGASIGMAVGIVSGMLFAPRSGKKIREEISRRTSETYASLRANIANTKDEIINSDGNQNAKKKKNPQTGSGSNQKNSKSSDSK